MIKQAPILSSAEWQEAWEHCSRMDRPAMYRCILVLIRQLGLRPLELSMLQSSWFRNGELRLPISYTGARNRYKLKGKMPATKGGKGRTIPYGSEVEAALAEHLQGRTGLVFLNQMGQPFDNRGMSKAVSRLLKRSVGDGSAYSGRRGFALKLNRAGVDPFTIQRLLGHSSVVTTMGYIPISLDDMRNAQALVD